MLKFIATALITCLCLLVATPASAQATRTWVSGVGDDVNPCSRTAPCKTFAGAISKTATGGEINCLDPAGYGTLTITKSITIDCAGTLGSVLASATSGFTINSSTAKVTLRNLSINGAGTTPGLNGIRVLAATSVIISNVTIEGFKTAPGIGISIVSGTPLVHVYDSEILRNNDGLRVAAAATAVVLIDNVRFTDNSSNGVVADGAQNNLALNNSSVINSAIGINRINNGQILTYGDNRILTNTNPGSFTLPVLTKN